MLAVFSSTIEIILTVMRFLNDFTNELNTLDSLVEKIY